jgi:hypothetical protein
LVSNPTVTRALASAGALFASWYSPETVAKRGTQVTTARLRYSDIGARNEKPTQSIRPDCRGHSDCAVLVRQCCGNDCRYDGRRYDISHGDERASSNAGRGSPRPWSSSSRSRPPPPRPWPSRLGRVGRMHCDWSGVVLRVEGSPSVCRSQYFVAIPSRAPIPTIRAISHTGFDPYSPRLEHHFHCSVFLIASWVPLAG